MKAAEVPNQSELTLRTDAEAVVEAVCSHTLAILQAGAYIARGYCKMVAYPEVLTQHRKRLMQFHPKQEQSRYQNAYTTLEASMQIIERSGNDETSQEALNLLDFLSIFHYENFPLAVLQSAWEGARLAGENDPDDQDIDALTPHHAAQLPRYLSPGSDTWDSFRLIQAMGLLESLALVKTTDLEDERSFISMHPLTHTWASIRQTDEQNRQSLLLSECIFALAPYSTLGEWQPWHEQFEAHALRLLHAKTGPDSLIARAAESRYTLQICVKVLVYLQRVGFDDTLHHSLSELFALLGPDPAVPAREFWLLYYMDARQATFQGNYAAAIHTYKTLLHAQNGNPLESDQMTSSKLMHNLGRGYLDNGQIPEAIHLFKEVMRIEERTLADTHPDRLASQYRLATTYLRSGQFRNATQLLEYVESVERTCLEGKTTRLVS